MGTPSIIQPMLGALRTMESKLLAALTGVLLTTACGVETPTAGTGAARHARSDLPDVLLVTIDTLRSDHTSTYGYGLETTPRLSASVIWVTGMPTGTPL